MKFDINMFNKILRKIRDEIGLLLTILSVSLGISAAMVSDGIKAFILLTNVNALLTIVGICEFLLGIFWLILTLVMLYEGIGIWKKYPKLITGYSTERDVSGLLRDLIAFYRGYYWELKAIFLAAIFVGFAMIISAIYLYTLNIISISRFYLDLLIGIFTSTFSLIAYLFIERKWSKKLHKIKAEENIFKDFLGEIN